MQKQHGGSFGDDGKGMNQNKQKANVKIQDADGKLKEFATDLKPALKNRIVKNDERNDLKAEIVVEKVLESNQPKKKRRRKRSRKKKLQSGEVSGSVFGQKPEGFEPRNFDKPGQKTEFKTFDKPAQKISEGQNETKQTMSDGVLQVDEELEEDFKPVNPFEDQVGFNSPDQTEPLQQPAQPVPQIVSQIQPETQYQSKFVEESQRDFQPIPVQPQHEDESPPRPEKFQPEVRSQPESFQPQKTLVTDQEFNSFDKPYNPFEASKNAVPSNQPINPFEADFTQDVAEKRVMDYKPLDDKPLENKPLDQVSAGMDVNGQDEFSAEAMDYTDEVDTQTPLLNPFADLGKGDKNPSLINIDNSPELITPEVVQRNNPEVMQEIQGEHGTKENVIETKISTKAEVEEFKESFWDILVQAGITRKTIITFLIIIFITVAGVLAFFLEWYKIFGFVNNSGEVLEKTGSQDEVDDQFAGFDPVGTISSYIFGKEFGDAGLSIGSLSGLNGVFVVGRNVDLDQELFVEYLDLLRKMQNIFETDLYALLDRTTNRRDILIEHIEQIKTIIDEGNNVFEFVKQRLADLDNEYGLVSAQRDQLENAFFGNVQALAAQQSYNDLLEFINLSQKSQSLRAEYSALKVVGEMMGRSLDALEPRYQDIVANQEAIIKGVKVFDIPGSDIQAIIRLE